MYSLKIMATSIFPHEKNVLESVLKVYDGIKPQKYRNTNNFSNSCSEYKATL